MPNLLNPLVFALATTLLAAPAPVRGKTLRDPPSPPPAPAARGAFTTPGDAPVRVAWTWPWERPHLRAWLRHEQGRAARERRKTERPLIVRPQAPRRIERSDVTKTKAVEKATPVRLFVPLPPPAPLPRRARTQKAPKAAPPAPLAPIKPAVPPVAPKPTQPAQTSPPAPPAQPAQVTPATPPARANGYEPLHMSRTEPEEIGLVPDHYFWLRERLQAAQDPFDQQLVFFGDEGAVVGRAKLPAGFFIGRIAASDSQVRLFDEAGKREIVIPRNIDPGTVTSFTARPVTAQAERQIEVTRTSHDLMVLRAPGRAGVSALSVRGFTGGLLSQAREISTAVNDPRYVISEEITSTDPAMQVRVFVQRFDRAGKLTGVVYVPLRGMEVVPRDFIAVDGDGRVRALVSTHDGVRLRLYAFQPPPAAGRLDAAALSRFSRSIREVAVDTKLISNGERARFHDKGPRIQLKVPVAPITREKILENARAYLHVDWVMQPENYSHPEVRSDCSPKDYQLWQRPRHFRRDLIGKTIGPMPYRWGGGDTPQTFRTRVAWGALAGNVCTCRYLELNYCVYAPSAGVDCSGFISGAWGIPKRGTSGLLDVSNPVDNLADLRPGDAFDWPERHVRLFTGMASGPEVAFEVLESSTRFECEGVCARTLRPSQLNGYRMIRYQGVTGGASP